MKRRRQKLLAGLLCVILSVTTAMPDGTLVLAKQLGQDGPNPVTGETGNEDTEPEGQDTEPGSEEETLKDPEMQEETDTAGGEPELEESKTAAESETETEAETETETETVSEPETEMETETFGEETENATVPEILSDDIMPIPSEQADAGEYPNAEIPFEIGGTDIYAGLEGTSLYSTSRVDVTAAKYDPRIETPEEMTVIGNQNPYGTCWAFAMMATLENSMIRQGFSDNSINLSERHLAYFARNSGSDRLGNASDDSIVSSPSDTYLNAGGNAYMAAVRLMNWQGAAAEADYPYSNSYTLPAAIDASKAQDAEVLAHDVYFVPTRNASKEAKMDAVKKLISEYGCVQWSYFHDGAYYNTDAGAYYDPIHTSTNHAITVVGWDDDYSAENFGKASGSGNKPDSNGAWIVKNSWGTGWGENGYFYISYEDKSLGSGNPASVSVAVPADTYDNNYFYGNTAYCTTRFKGYYKASQVYQVQGAGEQLKAVSFMLYSDKKDYSIQIYKNPELADGVVKDPESGEAMLEVPVTGTTGYSGYYTIDLPEPVALEKGDRVSIVIDFKAHGNTGRDYAYLYTDSTASDSSVSSTYHISNENITQAGQSFYYAWDSDEYQYRWFDAHNDGFNLRINALTADSELMLSETRIELAPKRVHKLKIVQQPTLDSGMAGAVSFESSDESIVTVSKEGVLTGISPGDAKITAKTNDRNGKEVTAVCKVTVTGTEDIAGGSYGDIVWFIDAKGKLTVEGTGDFARVSAEDILADNHTVPSEKRAPWILECEKITSAQIKVTGMTDASYMFWGCENLKEVDLDEFDTSQVTNMTRMFGGCYSLKNPDLSGFDTGRVKYMAGMFEGLREVESLGLSSFDTGSVTDMYGMFYGCGALKNIDLSYFDTGNVTDMSYMFAGCESLKGVDVSHFNTGNVADMNAMFYGCSQLTTLDLRSFDLGKVAENGGEDVFGFCSGLTAIYTPVSLSHSIALPDGGIWYQPDGKWCQYGETVITELPKNLSYSILITKNERPVVSYLTVRKTKTDYECGETLVVDDLTADYVNSRGVPEKLTAADYTTNADEIDLSTPGTKTLVITHVDAETNKEVTAGIELKAVYNLKKDSLTVRLSDEYPDGTCVYDGAPKTPALEVKTSPAGMVLTEGTDYTAVFENNVDAGTAAVVITGQNDYRGTVSYSFTIRKAAAPEAEEMEICYPAGREQREQRFDIAGQFTKYGEITEYHVSYTENTEAGRSVFSKAPYIAEGILCYDISAGKEDDEAAVTVEISFANYENAVVVLNVKFVDEEVVYKVTFDMAGHAAEIPPVIVYGKEGLIEEPGKPEEKGYRFTGWYKDRDCTELWDFRTDMVEGNMTLYAGWFAVPQKDIIEGDLYLQEIKNQTYTGSPVKPALQVYAIAKDGKDIPLKQGKDYTVRFYNNTNADSVKKEGGVSATGEEGNNGFTKSLPYAVITGKGNYRGTIYRNFHIDPVQIADKENADMDMAGTDAAYDTTLAKGFTLKYKDQLTSAEKEQKPFTSIKYKKSMKAGRDYTLQLSVLTAYDAEGKAMEEGTVIGTAGSTLKDAAAPAIPARTKGTFLLTITGKGNYSGTVKKTVYVSDQSHLMKNASVTLGKNQKKAEYTGEDIYLTPAYYDASVKKYYGFKQNDDGVVMDTKAELDKRDVFTVKSGKDYLKYGEDFEISYVNNNAVGTATMTIRGIGEYSGTKNITFRITGTAFNANNIRIDGLWPTMEYTGKALTQNGVVIKGINGIKSGEELVYRKDYTISYKNNLKKGTATMTFTAKPSSGYTGSFKKTFKINAAGLAADTVTILTTASSDGTADDRIMYTADGIQFAGKVVYTKAGAKISDRICLQNKEGFALKEGTDYTVSYSGNRAVTTGSRTEAPSMKIRGKGNYAGELVLTFEISKASLEENANISASPAAVAYNRAKPEDYEYRPKIKVMDGKQALDENNDYGITYYNCTQAEVKSYLETLESFEGASGEKVQAAGLENKKPYALVTAKGEGNYEGSRRVELTIYQNKLTGSRLYVVFTKDETQLTYTGEQVKPEVTVYYGDSDAVKKAKRAKVTDEKTLLQTYGLKKLAFNEAENGDDRVYGDYTLTYGTNMTAGKNKGSVTVTGTNLYGGSVKVKFTILRKDVYTASK